MDYSFAHLDESVTKVYRGTVLYSFETSYWCTMLKVKNGYVIETPPSCNEKWVRGQHIGTLKDFYEQIKPIRIISDGY
jgi:hypothetical protein